MEDRLKKYNSKRNFGKTSEPPGKMKPSVPQNLKFSVQLHSARALHYDLRLEYNGAALSWAVPKGPSFCISDKRLAVRVEDHPADYMDFEGIIPAGEYGGGAVMLWDEGVWKPLLDPSEGLKKGSLKFVLEGKRLKGGWALVKMKPVNGAEQWLLIKERDRYAKKTAGISRFTRGVRSGKSMAEIAASGLKNPFKNAEVMLAAPCEVLPSGGEWIYELKYDGQRVLSFSEMGKTALYSRNGRDCTTAFGVAANAVSKLLNGRAAVLDGEMTVAGEGGIPDFGALRAYAKNKGDGGLNYVLFDLLALDGRDLRPLSLAERKQKLKELLKDAPQVLTYSEHTAEMTAAGLKNLKDKGMEGVVAKNKNSVYAAGRNGDWQKLKFRKEDEYALGGYILSENGGLRSVLLGHFKNGKLCFAGCAGTGFTKEDEIELLKEFSKLKRKTSPFCSLPSEYAKKALFVTPKLAARTAYAEVTRSGVLRQASFKGLRRDVSPVGAVKRVPPSKTEKSVKAKTAKSDKAKTAAITVTHPQKVMFSDPVITKRRLLDYYAAVAEKAMPYIKDRFLSAVCCPSGTDGQKIFRRHINTDFGGIGRSVAGGAEYFYAKDESALIYLAQCNAVEFHVWASRKSSPYRPDVMVFDLDPDEGLPLKEVRRGVTDLKEVLDCLGLKSFLKTSGGKGYHIVVPFKSGADGEVFCGFSKRVAALLAKKYPERYTSSPSKKARAGKIYIDWQRNGPGATSVAPYSVRARRGAPVSMPIGWDELFKVLPASVTIRTALKRPGGDPWADFFEVKASQRLIPESGKK